MSSQHCTLSYRSRVTAGLAAQCQFAIGLHLERGRDRYAGCRRVVVDDELTVADEMQRIGDERGIGRRRNGTRGTADGDLLLRQIDHALKIKLGLSREGARACREPGRAGGAARLPRVLAR